MAMTICGNCGRDKRNEKCEHCGAITGEPTGADLDAVVAEQQAADATGGDDTAKTDGDSATAVVH